MSADDDLEAAVSRWATDEASREASRIRAAARQLEEAAAEERDFAGVLGDLAGRGPVRLDVVGGRVHRGLPGTVGRDFLSISTGREWGLVALRAVVAVSVAADGAAGGGGRDPASNRSVGDRWATGPDWSPHPPADLAAAVERLAGRELLVRVRAFDDRPGPVGELEAVGEDFLRLACGPDRPTEGRSVVYVPLGSVAELWLLFRSG